MRYLVRFDIQLAPIEVCLYWHIVTKVSNSRSEISHSLSHSNAQHIHDELAQNWRGKKLAVFDFFLSLRELVIVGEIRTLQAMQPTVPSVGVENILTGNSLTLRQILIDKVENLFIQFLTGLLWDSLIVKRVFHTVTTLILFVIIKSCGWRLLSRVLQEPRPYSYYRGNSNLANHERVILFVLIHSAFFI